MKILYTLAVFLVFIFFSNNAHSQLNPNFYSTDTSGTASTGGCAPFLVTFHYFSAGAAPTSFSWNFGDGPGISTDTAPQHNYAVAGLYTVTLIVKNATDSAGIIKINYIRVFNNPDPSFSTVPDTICSGDSILFTDTSIPGDTIINQWSWSFDDGGAAVTGVNPVYRTYVNSSSPIRVFFPSLIVTDANGCRVSTASNADTVFVLQTPTASFTNLVTSCTLPAPVNFTNTSSTGPALYTWDFGDPGSGSNNTSSITSPSHTYTAAGSYVVKLTNGVPGCSAEFIDTIDVIPPLASFTVDTIACRNTPVSFTNTSVPSGATYTWRFGDLSAPSAVKDPLHTYNNPNTYMVTLTTVVGTCSSVDTQYIRVPNPPSLNFSTSDTMACDTSFSVTFNPDTTSTNVGFEWTFGDAASGAANTSTQRNPIHSFNDFGQYTIKLVVTDIYGCKDSIQLPNFIRVQPPILDFTVVDSGCVGETFNYTAIVQSPSDPVVTDYTWNFGDGTGPISVATPGTTHQFNTVGIFDVSLTITTQTGCTATLTKTQYARVGTQPAAFIDTTRDTICFKESITFTDLTPPPVTGWLWFFGDGGSSTEQNPSHQYNIDTSGIADPFDVMLIAYYNGCPDTFNFPDMIAVQSPIPNFDIIYNCTNPDSVQFVNLTGGGDTFSWDFGDASPLSTDTNPSHIYPGSNDWVVVLTATNLSNGCVVDTTLQASIRNLTAVANSDSIQACRPVNINFTGGTSQDAVTWHWDFGDPASGVLDTSAEADTLHLYSNTGLYLAQLTTTDIHGCVKQDTQQVYIIGPTAHFMADSLGGCVPVGVLFTDTSDTEGGAILQYTWNFGAGGFPVTTTSDTISTTYNAPGLYSVTLTVTDVNGCTNTHIATNYINPTSPTAGIAAPDTGCSGSQLLTGSAGPVGSFAPPVTYFWQFGDNDTLTTNSSTTNHNYSQNGAYTITLTVTDANGCADGTTKNFFAYTTPAVFHFTTVDDCIVVNGVKQAIIDAHYVSDSNTYVENWYWDLVLKQDSDVVNPPLNEYVYRYNAPPGSYDATLTIRNHFGCVSTATTVGAIVIPGPTGGFSFVPDSGCSPLTVDFAGSSSSSFMYAWDFDDGTVINDTPDSLVQHTYQVPGVYHPQFYLGFQLTNSFCYVPVPSPDSIIVTTYLNVDIIEDTVVIHDGETALLNVDVDDPLLFGPPYNYVWDPASLISGPPGGPYTAAPADDTRYYTLSIPYGTQGCSAADKVLVIYLPCDEDETVDTIPNVFTPNGDGWNGTFHIDGLCTYDAFYIKIFNRWGKLIWESNEPTFAWDGKTTGGTDASEGVYYYVLKGRTKELHGYIDLIRSKN